jgi:ATP-binding cassette subfamily B multidrug efflux pump
MKLIFTYLRRHLAMFLTAVTFLTFEAVADLLQPTMMASIVDEGVARKNIGAIWHFGAIMLAIAAGGALCAVMRNILATRTSQTIGLELRGDLYRKVQSLSFENIDRLRPSSIITRLTNDVTQIQNFINSCMRMLVKAPITCVGAIILMLMQTPQQFPIMAAILCIAAVLIFGSTKLGYPRYGRLQAKLDGLNRVSREFLTSVRVVKAFGAEEQEKEAFSAAAEDFAGAGISAARVLAVFSPLINLTVNMGIVLLLSRSQRQDAGQIGRLMASVNYMTQVLFSLGFVSNILNSAVRALASSSRVSEIFAEKPSQSLPETPLTPELRGAVELENVTFSYPGSQLPALDGVSFSLAAGRTLGIIGPTGSGKSTLVSLIPRFYDAGAGRVLVDGADVKMTDIKALRAAVAVVPQKALLFTGTIADNLRWGRRDADFGALRRAARDACADDFIMSFPDGYDTLLGQGGVNLSGGQKQRLCIARALLREPKILILDDCTSALDADTEARVLGALTKKAGEMTVLIISQRISTVLRADRILCLADGRASGFGTHPQLMSGCTEYREIFLSQLGGSADA